MCSFHWAGVIVICSSAKIADTDDPCDGVILVIPGAGGCDGSSEAELSEHIDTSAQVTGACSDKNVDEKRTQAALNCWSGVGSRYAEVRGREY